MTVSPSTDPFSPEIRRFLEEPQRFGVLATLDADGSPHCAVVWYLVEHDSLVVNSAVGRRWPANLVRDPRYSLTLEDGYVYVTLKGRATVMDDPEQAQADIAAMARRYHPAAHAEKLIQNTFRPQRRISFRLPPTQSAVHGDVG